MPDLGTGSHKGKLNLKVTLTLPNIYPLGIILFHFILYTYTHTYAYNMTEIRDYYESIDVHIRLADGSNLIVTISPNDSVEALKRKVVILLFNI